VAASSRRLFSFAEKFYSSHICFLGDLR